MRKREVCPCDFPSNGLDMSAHLRSLHRCCQRSALILVTRRPWCSSSTCPPPPPPPLRSRLLLFLTQHFYDVENFLNWWSKRTKNRLRKRNAYLDDTKSVMGPDIASAHYVLRMRGGFRYVGQSEWFRADQRGSWNFVDYKDTPLEEVDLSYTDINYTGLQSLENQPFLRTLKLQGCPQVDDWFLARLHVLQDSLEELDISHCPRITTNSLAALRNLKGLKRLDMSSLPGITNPGLAIILLEEMLPECQITATGYDHKLIQVEGDAEEEQEHIQRQR